jgi:alpha-tubulin suppressor-like RCC1 family protein
VFGGLTFASLSAGDYHTCGVTPAGVAYCWGYNGQGAVGDGTITHRQVPSLVAGGLTFAAVSASAEHTCGLTTSGAAYCWGANGVGQLGDGTTEERHAPTLVAGGLIFTAVSAGGSVTCGLTAAGAAYCWGHPAYIGNGGAPGDTHVPTLVSGGLTFATLSAGSHSHNCAVTTSGTAYCWGSNSNGKLGDGSSSSSFRDTPTPVAGGLTFAAVSAGAFYTCGVTTSGAAYCWGWNQYGQMGDGTSGTDHLVPTPVAGDLTFAAVSAGFYQTCGVTTSSVAYCWGYNGNGGLGDGTTDDRLVPTAVASPAPSGPDGDGDGIPDSSDNLPG